MEGQERARVSEWSVNTENSRNKQIPPLSRLSSEFYWNKQCEYSSLSPSTGQTEAIINLLYLFRCPNNQQQLLVSPHPLPATTATLQNVVIYTPSPSPPSLRTPPLPQHAGGGDRWGAGVASHTQYTSTTCTVSTHYTNSSKHQMSADFSLTQIVAPP